MSLSQTGQQLATMTREGASFQIWSTQTGELVKEIIAPDGTRFDNVAIAQDGRRVAAITENLSTHALTLAVCPSATGEQIWQKPLDIAQNQLRDRRRENAPIVQVAFTPNGSEVVTQLILDTYADSPANNQLRFQSAATGEAVQSLDYSISTDTRLQKIAFSPEGQFFASASHIYTPGGRKSRVDIWRLNQAGRFEPLGTLPTPEDSPTFLDMVFVNNVLNISTLTGQDFLAIARLDTWNIAQTNRQPSRTDSTEWDRTDSFTRLSPDGEYYFVRGDVAGSRLNNIQTGERKSLGGEYADTAALFSGNGDYLAIANSQNISIFTKTANSNP